MKKWTVMLMYPDYAGNGSEGQELYISHVRGRTDVDAVKASRLEACKANGSGINDPDDFRVLGVIPGHVLIFTGKEN